MSEAYKEAKPGRLIFKGGDAAAVEKKKKKHKKKTKTKSDDPAAEEIAGDSAVAVEDSSASKSDLPAGGEVYTIDAAKKMKYEDLFPVETKRYGYDPKNASKSVKRSVEESLDDRVKKKADRYCK